ncbi:MAG: 16S rRNA (cytidine(1402)-2'-O)-methyltransferase [Caulobacterales bacterium]|nr:16S rRNA (cytidine(1402)-2'-O)-methyltransferase [Caulobacterales bacterium]
MPSDAREPTGARPEAQRPEPGLYIVATPIGNLRDITLRALDVLAAADLVLAEDSRVSRKLLAAYGVQATVHPYHDHNAAKMRPKALRHLAEGAVVALISDAGTPLVSDPGYKLVRDALQAGAPVRPVPGASAALAALVAAGLPTDRFLFAGFPPAKEAGRRAAFAELAATPATLIFYETGPRCAASLADMAGVFGDRPAALARELTKLHEEVRRGPLVALAAALAEEPPPKGELVILIGPPEPAAWDDAQVDAALAEQLPERGVARAAAAVAELSGRPRREVYARALALKEEESR